MEEVLACRGNSERGETPSSPVHLHKSCVARSTLMEIAREIPALSGAKRRDAESSLILFPS